MSRQGNSTAAAHSSPVTLLRFRLRTLIVALCLLAIVACWFGTHARQAQRERFVIESLSERGGVVDRTRFVGPHLIEPIFGKAPAFQRVSMLSISNPKLRAEDLRNASKLTFLSDITVSSSEVPAQGLRELNAARNLLSIELLGAEIDSEHVEALAGCEKLQEVILESCLVTSDALDTLARMNLIELSLYDCEFPAEAIFKLAQSRSLKSLDVRECYLPDAFIAKLRESNPELQIQH